MYIKRRLQINSVGIVLLTLAIVSVLTITMVRVNRALQSSKIATAIFMSSYERLMLRTDSDRTRSERTRVQLIAKHKEIGRLLADAEKRFSSPQDQRVIHELLNRHDSIGLLSKTIRERRARMGPPADPLSQEAEDLLLSQLNTNVYESMLLQGKLLQSSQNAVDSSLRMAATAILVVLLLVASLVLVNSFMIHRVFAARIRALRGGATQIGAGELDYRIPVQGGDELGELAGTFNEMASKLSGSYRDLHGEIEERKRVEKALRQSETRLRRFYDSGLSGVVYWNLSGRILDANDRFLEMVGYSREDLEAGRVDWVRMTPPEYWEQNEGSIRELQAAGLNREPYEKEYLRKDGSRVSILVASAMLDEARTEGVAFVLDITARKEAEARLRHSEEKFALAFANNQAAISLTRFEDGLVLDANDTWFSLFGYRREEVIGTSLREKWGSVGDVQRFLQELKEHGSLRGWEQSFCNRSGECFDVQMSAQLMTVGGELVILTTHIDITERKRAEERVRESEERLRLLGDNLPESAVYQYIHDRDGGMRFLYFSAGVERLNCIAADEVLRDPGVLLRQVLPEYRDRLAQAEATSARDLTDFDMVLPMRKPDGRLRWMQLHSRPRQLPDGSVLWDGVQTDVTSRIEAEEELARQNAIVQGINRIFEAALSYEEDRLFGEICLAVAEEITGSRFGFIGAIGADGVLRDFALTDPGWEDCRVRDSEGKRIPHNFHIQGIFGAILTEGKGVLTNDPGAHPAAVGLPERHPPVTSFLGVPLTSGGRATGMIAVANREGGYREQDLAALEALAPALSEALQRREAESALREREVSFRMLIENNPNIIGRYDRQHRWLYLSPSAQSVTGQPSEIFLGKTARDMGFSPELCASWEEAQDRAFAGERVTIRSEVADAAERRRVLLTTFVPEGTPDGSIPTILAISQDITELIEAQEEKEVLLKEIHHRVKNNLQVISSLVSLQAGASADPAVREMLDEVSYRVRSMALVHEKLYRSADLAHIDFADYLDSLLSYIWRAHGTVAEAVRLTLELEPVALPVDTAVPCGLIVNELATNALKHAFRGREGGEVTVSLRKSGGGIRLAVADNGVGLPEGMDWRQAKSLGLRLVQMLAGQLDAEVAVRSGQGTTFDLIIDTRDQSGGRKQ